MTEAELFQQVTDFRLDPWCAVSVSGGQHLFGHVHRPRDQGGDAWGLTTALVTLDDSRMLGVTQDGTMYALGREVDAESLPSDGLVAFLRILNSAQAVH